MQERISVYFPYPFRRKITETPKYGMLRVHDVSKPSNFSKSCIQDKKIAKNIDHTASCRKTYDEESKTSEHFTLPGFCRIHHSDFL